MRVNLLHKMLNQPADIDSRSKYPRLTQKYATMRAYQLGHRMKQGCKCPDGSIHLYITGGPICLNHW